MLPQRHDAETSNEMASNEARCDVGRMRCQMGGPAGQAGGWRARVVASVAPAATSRPASLDHGPVRWLAGRAQCSRQQKVCGGPVSQWPQGYVEIECWVGG